MSDNNNNVVPLSSDEYQVLEDYCDLDGTEVGELCYTLMSVSHYPSYMLSAGFESAVHRELRAQLDNFKTNCTIRVEEETATRTYRYLDWDAQYTDSDGDNG